MVGSDKMKMKGKKAQVQITLPPELLEKAREYGLNISKITENALKEYIEALEKPKMTNGGSFLGEASFTKEGSSGRRLAWLGHKPSKLVS
jgi:hypothetical protein